MKFYANPSNIPEDNVVPVRNNIVYVENGFNYTIENREIRTPHQDYLTQKEVHDFVKVVVSNNKVSVLQHMINNGFQLKVVDLAYLACQHGCYEMTKLLMDKGGKPNYLTKYGWTPLEIASINGHFKIVKLLVEYYGGKINQENSNSHTTPLENAIEGGHLDTVRRMIEDLEADYHPSTMQVTHLQSAAKLAATMGELINPGNEYMAIREYLNRRSQGPRLNPKIDNLISHAVTRNSFN